MPVIEAIQASGITSLNGVAQELNARGIKTRWGYSWSCYKQVQTTIRNYQEDIARAEKSSGQRSKVPGEKTV